MKLRSKETYWLLKNGLLTTYPSLQKNIACDVLIIGSGITGALMAYQFSQEGYKTILIDKRDVGMGSTAATTAMLQYEIDEPLYKLIDKVGEDAAVDSYREGILAIEKMAKIVKRTKASCDFKMKRSLYVAHSQDDLPSLKKEFLCRKKFKFDVTWLTGKQLKSHFGIVGMGAILSDVGASADAYCLTHSLLAYSTKHYGLKVFDHTEAEHVEFLAGRNKVLTDGQQSIDSQYIIYASGYETQFLLQGKIVDLNSTYALVSEPLTIPKKLNDVIFWDTQKPYTYFRTTSDGRILVGGADEKFKNEFLRDKLMDRKETKLIEQIKKILPDVNFIPDFTWAGTFGVTKDALPYMGPHPEFPNSYFMLGFGGNGITFSIMGMKVLSDALSGSSNKFLEYYRFNR